MKLARGSRRGAIVHGDVRGDELHLLDGSTIFTAPCFLGSVVPLADVQLLSPTVPRTVLLVLGGFRRAGEEVPDDATPSFQVKALGVDPGGQGAEIAYPAVCRQPLTIETELAVVIGATTSSVGDDVWDAVAGFTVLNDVTAHEFLPDPTDLSAFVQGLFVSKSFDTFCMAGPWISTDIDRDAIADGLQIAARVNGVEQQRGNTKDYRVPVERVVRAAAEIMTLHPGDLIGLGASSPRVAAGVGDDVELEVEGVGVLKNRIVSAAERTR